MSCLLNMLLLAVAAGLLLLGPADAEGCAARYYGHGSIVCVCNSTYCDTIAPVTRLPDGQYNLYTTSKAGDRFTKTAGYFQYYNATPNDNDTLFIRRDHRLQSIFGFGGAFTDATGINVLSLSNASQQNLMKSYFGDYGIQYSMGRIPLAGTDFSTHFYTYDDVPNDYTLQYFSLQYEDYTFKIPLIHTAQRLTGNDINFFGSAWTAPEWMKTNNYYTGIGFLNLSMYDSWAHYYLKFIDSYSKHGINIWGLTTGNEPSNGYTDIIDINDMGWIPQLHGQWIAQFLGPLIRLSDHPYVKLMIIDDQRVYFPWIPRTILAVPGAAEYVDGSAVHYYDDQYVPAEVLSITHYDFPDKFIFASEGCTGSGEKHPVVLGSWERAETYLESMIDDMNNWVTGWMDWNMALNLRGGPTYVGNYVDSSIIVNKTADEFYKQPMFYAMGHYSKFLRPNSVRTYSTNTAPNLKLAVFDRPDGGTVVQIYNPTNYTQNLTVIDAKHRKQIFLNILENSMNSLVYW